MKNSSCPNLWIEYVLVFPPKKFACLIYWKLLCFIKLLSTVLFFFAPVYLTILRLVLKTVLPCVEFTQTLESIIDTLSRQHSSVKKQILNLHSLEFDCWQQGQKIKWRQIFLCISKLHTNAFTGTNWLTLAHSDMIYEL